MINLPTQSNTTAGNVAPKSATVVGVDSFPMDKFLSDQRQGSFEDGFSDDTFRLISLKNIMGVSLNDRTQDVHLKDVIAWGKENGYLAKEGVFAKKVKGLMSKLAGNEDDRAMRVAMYIKLKMQAKRSLNQLKELEDV